MAKYREALAARNEARQKLALAEKRLVLAAEEFRIDRARRRLGKDKKLKSSVFRFLCRSESVAPLGVRLVVLTRKDTRTARGRASSFLWEHGFGTEYYLPSYPPCARLSYKRDFVINDLGRRLLATLKGKKKVP